MRQWLEIVELRAADQEWKALIIQLKRYIRSISDELDHQGVKIYSHMTVDGDLRVHLQHDVEPENQWGSALGQRLNLALREYGLVFHSVWQEIALD